MNIQNRAGARNEFTLGGIPASRLAVPGQMQLPLVSFIVRNWNYGDFIGNAIASIKAQDYPRFEVIVVDNASTDNSRDIIQQQIEEDPRFRVVHSDVNLGPLGGALLGLESAKGEFVTFVDSDDTLLANFASLHIQAHLAASRNIAFTSCSTIETGPDGAVVNGRRQRSGIKETAPRHGLRAADIVPRLGTVDDEAYELLSQNTMMLGPATTGWLWSPGTANMYRRFMLDLLAPLADPIDLLKLSGDGHYNRLCHLIGGSAIIDLPLSTYRIHGGNFYVSTPSLASWQLDGGPALQFGALRSREMIRVLVANTQDFAWRIGEKRFWDSLFILVDLGQKRQGGTTEEFATFIGEQIGILAQTFGEKHTLHQLANHLPRDTLNEILRQRYGGSIPYRVRWFLHPLHLHRLKERVKRLARKLRIARD
ncbi:glycosyltransferase family 2 protein [Kaistia adipata]|uniref:glycosyltransferase family 2 protein n=1 Tax=Kaistia adipata TaxID=166954 RepID=UPI00146E8FBD|nr:glycosyltransferase family A protein [Kaistia adipata]